MRSRLSVVFALAVAAVVPCFEPGTAAAATSVNPSGPISQPVPYAPLRQGGFEVPDLGTGTQAYQYRPSGSAWSFAGGAGLAGNGSAFTSLNPPAPQGDQVLFIQGGAGKAEQTFAVAAGRYRLSVEAAQRVRATGPEDQVVSLRIDGEEVLQVRPSDGTYVELASQSFLLDLGFHTLEIASADPLIGGQTLFLDALRLERLAAIGDPWSDDATWGGTPPGPGSAVVIPADQIVILDTAAQVKSLRVDGELHCADDDISLAAEWILVHGRLECGSELSPFTDELTITLVGDDDGDDVMGMGDKFLAVMGSGVLELHGEPRLSWTQLAATAPVGATSLTLAESVDWRYGDEIVLAPTHEAYDEGETVTVTDVSEDGLTVDITPGLSHAHWGETTDYSNTSTTWTLDERGEVGLLSRNIKIQGDDSAATAAGFGGHMMSMYGTTVHAEGIELFRMGQKGVLARYPFHWHLVQEAPGQYLRNSSVHRSFNRCVTVHGTHDTLVADNVCYDFLGHGYFLEDGIEQRNTFDHNLGIWARKPAPGEALLETDLRVGTASNGPSVFWIAHPDNSYTRNAAAGSEGTGFWYGMVDEVTGPSVDLPGGDINPRTSTFGTFTDNRAHTSRQGFSSCRDAGGPFGMDPPNEALIEDLTVSNTGQGVWPCTPHQTKQNHRFVRTIVANSLNGMQAPNPMTFEDTLFVAYSANAPSGAQLGSGLNWRGVQVYDQGFLFDNVHFVNYDRPAMTAFYPGAGAHKLANNRGDGLSFENSPHVFLDPDNFAQRPENGPAWWGDVIHDLDGSFVGLDHAIVSRHPLMFDGTCHQPTDLRLDGYACPYRYAHFRTENYSQIDPVTVLRSDGFHETAPHITARFLNQFIVDGGYHYTYRYTGGMKHEVVQVQLRNAFAGDTSVYELLDVPSTFVVNDGAWTAAPTLRSLFDDPAGNRYFYRDGSLFLKMQASGDDWHALDQVNVCMTGTCNQGQVHALDLPSVAITAPADGARVPAGSPITVTADLADTQGIAAARLYLGLVRKGTDTAPPYSFTLTNVPAGSYPLKLVVEDTTGQTYTQVQQLLVGEPGPRVEITSIEDHQTFVATAPIPLAFDVHNWTVTGGGTHLRWLIDGVDQGPLYATTPISVPGLSQGKHEIRVALAKADGTITAMNDTVTVYSMENGMVADFEDGLDRRGSLTPSDAGLTAYRLPEFAWGTRDPVASRADPQDDINYFDVGNDGTATSYATYRLDLDPAQDWSGASQLEIKADGGLVYEAFVVDATSGATSLGFRVGGVTALDLPANSALVDEVVAIELRYAESSLGAGQFGRQHLRHIRLLP